MDAGRKLVREPLRVTIILEHYRIVGTVYLELGSRLSDFINTEMKFIPVRDATMESLSEKDKFSSTFKFINVNKDYLVAIFPENPEA